MHHWEGFVYIIAALIFSPATVITVILNNDNAGKVIAIVLLLKIKNLSSTLTLLFLLLWV